MAKALTPQQGFDKVGLTTETVVKRILRTLDKATNLNIFDGMHWYDEAKDLIGNLAYHSDYTTDQVACAMAHLSPRLRWNQNVAAVSLLVKKGVAPTYVMSGPAGRAMRALEAADPFATFGKKAKKTQSFARNVNGDSNAVTVDVWIARVVGISESQLKLVGVYEAVAHAYRIAAKRRGFDPAVLQAITWIVVRGSAT